MQEMKISKQIYHVKRCHEQLNFCSKDMHAFYMNMFVHVVAFVHLLVEYLIGLAGN